MKEGEREGDERGCEVTKGQSIKDIRTYSVFESFEYNAVWEQQPALACQTAQSRN